MASSVAPLSASLPISIAVVSQTLKPPAQPIVTPLAVVEPMKGMLLIILIFIMCRGLANYCFL